MLKNNNSLEANSLKQETSSESAKAKHKPTTLSKFLLDRKTYLHSSLDVQPFCGHYKHLTLNNFHTCTKSIVHVSFSYIVGCRGVIQLGGLVLGYDPLLFIPQIYCNIVRNSEHISISETDNKFYLNQTIIV